jgi:type IV pilus assembly protein PilB
VPKSELLKLGIKEEQIADGYQIYQGKGCEVCNGTGYKGRIAFYEVMKMTDPIKDAILNGASSMELKELAIKLGMKTMRMSANLRLLEGTTSIAEVLRNTAPDENA